MMKLRTAIAGVFGVLVLGSSPARADIALGNPAYGGTGCPSGSLGIALSPDQSALSVLFDRFSVDSSAGQLRSQCSLRIPVRLPEGVRISVVAVDYRGFASLPKKAHLALRSSHTFTKKNGKTKVEGEVDRVHGEKTGEFFFRQVLKRKWDSECGGAAEIALDIELALKLNTHESAQGTIDSMDVSGPAPVTYRIQVQRCR